MLSGQGDLYKSSKNPKWTFSEGNVHCLQLNGKPHPFTMVVFTQIIKAFVGRPGNTLEETCTIGGRPLLSPQCTLIPLCRVLMHPFSSVCIQSAQLTTEPVHPIPVLTIVGDLI